MPRLPSGPASWRGWPKDPLRFSGTVVVEWHNVSAGIDAAPDWGFFHRSLAAAGHAWVGVSAQKVGIDGGGFVESIHLKLLAPERYKDLEHPGDAWSFDIFTQVGALLQLPSDENPLGRPGADADPGRGRVPVRCLPGDVHQRQWIRMRSSSTASSCTAGRRRACPSTACSSRRRQRLGMEATRVAISSKGERIRDDARVPVLVLQSETDVILLGGGLAEQPDSDRLRTWEMAGAAHADTYTVSAGRHDDGTLTAERMAELLAPDEQPHDRPDGHADQRRPAAALRGPGRAGAPRTGGQPAGRRRRRRPRLELNGDRTGYVLDEHGIAKGGIRTPWVDVPTAVMGGLGQTGETFAMLFGRTEPFDEATLAKLYPGGEDEYLERFGASLDAAIAAGFLLEEDRMEILAVAAHSFPLRLAEG